VKVDKTQLVQVLRTQGENDLADRVESRLPDEIDTETDQGDLEAIGLDRASLQAKLAGSGFGGTLAP